MKTNLLRIAIWALVFLLGPVKSNAQISNYIYGLTNFEGAYYFTQVEIGTGVQTNLSVMPFTGLGMQTSSIDAEAGIYYLCTGTNIISIDPLTGAVISDEDMGLDLNASLRETAFNPCDGYIYGIVVDLNTGINTFSKYLPGSQSVEPIAPVVVTGFSSGGCFIDETDNLYITINGNITGLDLNTGDLVVSTPIQDLTNEFFGHASYACDSHKIIGTSANLDIDTKYLSSIDLNTGVVTHISDAGWHIGLNKPSNGGNTIDQGTSTYYYSGAGGMLVGANLNTGEMEFGEVVTTEGADLFLIEHFSECSCTTLDVHNSNPIISSVYPSPFTDQLIINVSGDLNVSNVVTITDMNGRTMINETVVGNITLDTQDFPAGIYFYQIRSANGQIENGKVVKL